MGEYWYTLARVQYHDGQWQDSLRSLDELRAKEGKLDAFGWFVTAMNRKQLKQGEQAKDAYRKGVKWIEERQKQAADDPVLRYQYESMREPLEQLRKDTEKLLEGERL